MENVNVFVGKVLNVGGSLGTIIPQKNIDFGGLKKGDYIKVYVRRIEPENAENEPENASE